MTNTPSKARSTQEVAQGGSAVDTRPLPKQSRGNAQAASAPVIVAGDPANEGEHPAARASEKRRRAQLRRGIVCALAGGALWGLSGACSQFLLSGYDVTPAFITCVRMLGSGIMFLALLAFARRDTLAAMLRDRASLLRLAIFGVGGLFLCQITYVTAVGYTNAGTATVLQSTCTVVIMAVTCVFTRKLPNAKEAVGLVCALLATWLIATQGNPAALALPAAGLLWGAANSLSCAFYIMYPKRLFERWGSLPVTGVGMLVGGIAALAFWIAEQAGLTAGGTAGAGAGAAAIALPSLDATGIAVLVVIVVLGTFAAFALYLHGVSVVGPVTGGLLGTVEPASATICSALWLGTVFSPADWAGFALMMAMIVLVAFAKENPRAAE